MASDGAIYAVMLALCAQEQGHTLRETQAALGAAWKVMEPKERRR